MCPLERAVQRGSTIKIINPIVSFLLMKCSPFVLTVRQREWSLPYHQPHTLAGQQTPWGRAQWAADLAYRRNVRNGWAGALSTSNRNHINIWKSEEIKTHNVTLSTEKHNFVRIVLWFTLNGFITMTVALCHNMDAFSTNEKLRCIHGQAIVIWIDECTVQSAAVNRGSATATAHTANNGKLLQHNTRNWLA